jgi:hypothetical protein
LADDGAGIGDDARAAIVSVDGHPTAIEVQFIPEHLPGGGHDPAGPATNAW